MSKYRGFADGDRFPADFPDAVAEFLGSSAHNFLLRIKPGDATKLQVPAGTDNDQVAIAINGKWRYNTATVERASLGGLARNMDVFVTGSDNVFTPGGGGEVDSTDYSFGVAIVEAAASPTGVALSRKVATAAWDGAQFTSVDVLVGAQAGTARHAATHYYNGPDPLIGFGASLPGSPADGQLFDLLVDDADGIVWRFRYRAGSSSAHKWEFVGGPPMHADVQASGSSSTLAYSALGSAGPSLTIPLAGDYDITIGANIGTATAALMSYDIGATPASSLDAVEVANTAVATVIASVARTQRKTGLAAATALVAKYSVAGGVAATFANRFMSVRPVRLG